jgi:hypothetical protein
MQPHRTSWPARFTMTIASRARNHVPRRVERARLPRPVAEHAIGRSPPIDPYFPTPRFAPDDGPN